MKYVFLWFFAAMVAVYSGVALIGSVAAEKAPELALFVQPNNGFAAQSLVLKLTRLAIVDNGGKIPDLAEDAWSHYAAEAFSSEPATPEAVAVLALTRTGQSRRSLMVKAFELSRREELVTGWLITDGSARNDIRAVLHYYDTILRTNSAAAELIMPTMVGALQHDGAIKPYVEILANDPPWAENFWGQVTLTPVALENAVDVRRRLFEKKLQSRGYRDADLIIALTIDRQFERARQLYMLLDEQLVDSAIVRNANFQRAPKFPPLDWQIFSTGEYGATIEGGKLILSAMHNSGGLFARQLIEIPSQKLQLRIILRDPLPPRTTLNAKISCAQKDSIESADANILITKLETKVAIDNAKGSCQFFWIDIYGKSDQEDTGFEIAIKSISMWVTQR